LAKFPEFEFLELGMILYLLVMTLASNSPHKVRIEEPKKV